MPRFAHHWHRSNEVELNRLYADRVANVWASTRAPRAMSSGEANSSGRWLYPWRQGMNSIATGAMRAMKKLANSNRCNSVYRSADERRILDGQNQFRSSAKCVLTISHKDSTSVSTGAFDKDTETCRCSDMSDDAECDALAFQDRPLL